MNKNVLLIFAKSPTPGTVKTRLVPPLSREQAARLYAAFLEDAMHTFRSVNADLLLFHAGPPLSFPGLAGIYPQRGEELGDRMKSAFEHAFSLGYARAVVVGSDHPTLPVTYLTDAFAALEERDAVVAGPADDGGYYLLGMSAYFPVLFEDMRYSHAGVLSETVIRAERSGAAVKMLPAWYDVDTVEDLHRLITELEETSAPASSTRGYIGILTREVPQMSIAGINLQGTSDRPPST